MEPDNLIQNPKPKVREGWEQSFERMHAEGDDQLLIPDVFEDETFEEWLQAIIFISAKSVSSSNQIKSNQIVSF